MNYSFYNIVFLNVWLLEDGFSEARAELFKEFIYFGEDEISLLTCEGVLQNWRIDQAGGSLSAHAVVYIAQFIGWDYSLLPWQRWRPVITNSI
jgi:hypothetical protein